MSEATNAPHSQWPPFAWRDGLESRCQWVDTAAFIRAHTAVRSPPLCPEIRLHLAETMASVWEAAEEAVRAAGLPPPFWAACWPGGLALARYILDRPSVVAGKRVLDLGSGSGLCGIAAAKAGAAHVDGSDLDPFALAAIRMNAAMNSVLVHPIATDVVGTQPARWDVILAGDLWYERWMAKRVTAWLRDVAAEGCYVLLGDKGRAYSPRHGVERLACYRIGNTLELEGERITAAATWRIRA